MKPVDGCIEVIKGFISITIGTVTDASSCPLLYVIATSQQLDCTRSTSRSAQWGMSVYMSVCSVCMYECMRVCSVCSVCVYECMIVCHMRFLNRKI